MSETSFTTSFKLVAAPHATLKTPPNTAAAGADAAARFASTVLSMKQEVARLVAVAEDGHTLVGQRGGDEARDDGCVLGGRILARPEHVEVAQADRLEAIGAREHGAVMLAGQLSDRVGRQRRRSHRFDLGQRRRIAVRRRGGRVYDPPTRPPSWRRPAPSAFQSRWRHAAGDRITPASAAPTGSPPRGRRLSTPLTARASAWSSRGCLPRSPRRPWQRQPGSRACRRRSCR